MNNKKKILKISINTNKNFPMGVYVNNGKQYYPIILFRKPKGFSDEDFNLWIECFKGLYEENMLNKERLKTNEH